MFISNFVGGGIILITGLILGFFKLSGLIAGYNTMTNEEREKYDEEKLVKFVSKLLIYSGMILIAGGLLSFILGIPNYISVLSWVMFSVFIIIGVVYMNTGSRFYK